MITASTKKIGIVSLLLVVVVGVALYLLFRSINTLGTEVVSTAQAVSDYSAQTKSSSELDTLLEDTAEERAILDEVYLNESTTIDFLADIESIADNQGVLLTTDSLEVIEEKDVAPRLQVRLTIEGMQAQVLSMIRVLETVPYASYLSSVQLTSQIATESEPGDTSAAVVLQVVMSNI